MLQNFSRYRRVLLNQLDQVIDAVHAVVELEILAPERDLKQKLSLSVQVLLVVLVSEGPLEDGLFVFEALPFVT